MGPQSSSSSGKGKALIASTGLRQFVFLASHGLRNPLTAIRWSCGRLEKLEKDSSEAMRYVEQIAANTKRLTRILGAIFLLSRLQDQLQPMKTEPLKLSHSLQVSIPDEEDAGTVSLRGAGDVTVLADEEVLHSLLSCVFMACFVAFNGGAPKPIVVDITDQGDTVVVSWETEAELQFLRTVHPEKFHSRQDADQLIGGTTGLLLTLSRDLAIAMGGYLKLEEREALFTVRVTVPKSQA